MSDRCLFVSDLHGRTGRVHALARAIATRRPAAVFVGGDLFPPFGAGSDDFLTDTLVAELARVRDLLGPDYPAVFLILGNDDPRILEAAVQAVGGDELWFPAHGRAIEWHAWKIFGYSCVPPTPFHLKDWERYDVSRHVDPGCVSPEDGFRTLPINPREIRYGTIASDLEMLARNQPLDRSIWLFHSPPYGTLLDRAALDGKVIDHAPLDLHVGSIAIRRFIERHQPAVTLHGHIHESARITGCWTDRIGRTVIVSAAHDGPELALVTFDPGQPENARRELIAADA